MICNQSLKHRLSLTALTLLLTLSLGWPATLQAQSQGDPVLNEEMLWKMFMVQAPVASPDGQRLVYGVRTTELALNKSQPALHSLDLSHQKSTRLTSTPSSEGEVRWSPDGQWLVFLN